MALRRRLLERAAPECIAAHLRRFGRTRSPRRTVGAANVTPSQRKRVERIRANIAAMKTRGEVEQTAQRIDLDALDALLAQSTPAEPINEQGALGSQEMRLRLSRAAATDRGTGSNPGALTLSERDAATRRAVPREPTPAMCAAGFAVPEAEHDPAGVWRAMYDAAAPDSAATSVRERKLTDDEVRALTVPRLPGAAARAKE